MHLVCLVCVFVNALHAQALEAQRTAEKQAKEAEAAKAKAEYNERQAGLAAEKQAIAAEERWRIAEEEKEAAELRAKNAINALASAQHSERVEHDLSHIDLCMVPSAWLHRRATSTIGPSDAVVVAVDVLDELVKCTLERCRVTSEGYCLISATASTPSSK